jgi:hypothetical protein
MVGGLGDGLAPEVYLSVFSDVDVCVLDSSVEHSF